MTQVVDGVQVTRARESGEEQFRAEVTSSSQSAGAGLEAQGLNEETLQEKTQQASMSPRCTEHARVWTPARRVAVESYVDYLKKVLRLQDWTITIDWSKPTGKDALATMTQMSDSRHATLRLSPEFISTESQLHGQILLHEMLHCHLFQMESLAVTMMSALAGKEATNVFARAYTSANELTTDALADVIEPLLTTFRLP